MFSVGLILQESGVENPTIVDDNAFFGSQVFDTMEAGPLKLFLAQVVVTPVHSVAIVCEYKLHQFFCLLIDDLRILPKLQWLMHVVGLCVLGFY